MQNHLFVVLQITISSYTNKRRNNERTKANAVVNEVKEIRFGPNTDEHDVDFKLKHASKFLE
jgi:translation initiation factor IF-3